MSGREPAELLQTLRSEGFEIESIDDRLRVTHPTRELPENLREELRQHRDGVLELLIEETVATVRALTLEEQEGWRREVVHSLLWVEAGRLRDSHLMHDLRALRRIVPDGSCLLCSSPCPRDGRHWCDYCNRKFSASRAVTS